MLNKLKFIALPKPDESPKSLLIRTAHANGFRSVAHMASSLIPHAVNAKPLSWQLAHSELIQVIAADAGEHRDAFLSGIYTQLSRVTTNSPVIFFGVSTPLTKLRRSQYAFCPGCARDGWQQLSQELSILETCPQHNCEFVYQCPGCESPLAWHQLDGNSCKCGFDLATTKGKPCPSHGSAAVLRAYHSCDQNVVRRLHAAMKALRVEDVGTIQERQEIMAIAGLIALEDRSALETTIKTARTLHPELPKSMILAPWLSIADDWLQGIIADISSNWTATVGSVKEATPAPEVYFYRDEIRRALQISSSEVGTLVKSGVISKIKRSGKLAWIYTSHNWLDTAISLQTGRAETNHLHENKTLDINASAVALNTYPEAVRRAAKAGAIACIQSKSGRISIPKEAITQFRLENIFIGELAKSLGASNTTLRARLISVGITPISGPKIDGGLVSIYRRSDLDSQKIKQSLNLKTYSNNAGRKKTSPPDQLNIISSTEAAAHLGIAMQRLQHFQKFGLLVQAARYVQDTDYRRYFTKISVSKTKEWLDSSITIEHVATETKSSTQSLIRRFVKTNYVKTVKVGNEIILSKFDLPKIIHHLEIYCSCDQADKFLGAPSGHVSNLIATQRLKVAPSKQTRISTIRLIHWTDVRALLK